MGKESKYNLDFNLEHNSIVCGDCEEWLQFIPDSSVDLIYIDPPFFSNKKYEIVWGNGYELRSFGDRWKGGVENYIEWMEPKIKIAKDKLKDTGVIALHCDWHASHRLRCLLDNIFDEKNFVNEVIWHYKKWTNSPSSFQKNHDNIFFYKKGKKHIFNKIYQDYANLKWVENTVRISKNGKLVRAKDKDGNYITREKSNQGVPMHDVFHDISWGATNPERVGYRTQKPEALIKRFVQCFTNEGGLVLDFFGGGGTTAKVCADLKRRFITGDVSPVAVRVIADRLLSKGYNDYDVKVTADRLLAYRNKGYEVKFLPSTKEEFLKLNDKSVFGSKGSHWLSKMICEFKGWQSNPKISNDKGIDGWAKDRKVAVQIKNHGKKIGRPDVQKFFGAVSGKYEEGIFVAWEFSRDAEEYRAEKNGVIKFEKIENIIGSTLLGEDTRLLSRDERVKHQKLFYGIHKEKNGKIKYKGASKKITESPWFAKMICESMGWQSNLKKSNNKRIKWINDGKIAIQINNHNKKIELPDIKNFFEAVSDKYEKGIFVACEFSKEAEEYRAEKNDLIIFKKIEDIIGKTLLGEDTRLLPKDERKQHRKSASAVEIQKEQEKSKRKRKKVGDNREKIGTSVNNAKTSISSRKKSLL